MYIKATFKHFHFEFQLFLPAATKLGQGNIFTGVCLSTGGEGCLPQCMLGYPPEQTPPEQTPPKLGTPRTRHPLTMHPPQTRPPRTRPPQTRPPWEADCSIRLTSGRYASYWNAFLSSINFILNKFNS